MSTEPQQELDAPRAWRVVSQVKSHRVVYFTDDPEYEPPMQGDWYYVSPYEGELPTGMTLRNCWRWRFNGMQFTDAGKARPADREKSLLAHNKSALLDALNQRIDALRRPFEPSCLAGAELRARKLEEARACLRGDGSDTPFLREAAAAYLCTLEEMARRIVEHDRVRGEVMLSTESQRERLSAAIARAATQHELIALRERITQDVAAADVEPQPFKPENTTPEKKNQPLQAQQLADERLRLRVQLRNRINDLRRPFVSQYLMDEHVQGRKAEIAVAVERAGGALPPGLDGTLLLSHAAVHGQGIAEAAREVLCESREIRNALIATERMKDATLARIAGASTLGEIRDIGRGIEALALDASSPGEPAKGAA